MTRLTDQKSKYLLPQWPQKENQLRKVRGLRRRLLLELQSVNDLAKQLDVPTTCRPVMEVLSDIEWMIEQTPSHSPTYQENRK